MKHLFLLALVLNYTFSSFAQKVDLDRFSFSLPYRQLPAMIIDTSFHTYDFSLQTGPLMQLGMGQEKNEGSLLIEGWRRLDEPGHISVKLIMEDLIIIKTDVVTREVVKKDKEGKVTGKSYFYAPVTSYTYGARMTVKDYNGIQLQSRELVTRQQTFQYRGPEFANRIMASNILLNMMTLSTQISREVLNKTICNLSADLTYDYGYAQKWVNDQIWILDSKKHPEYRAFRQHWGNIKNALFKLHPDSPTEPIRLEMQPDIKYFEQIAKNYTGTGKSDRKIKYAAYLILSKLYYYLDDPDAVVNHATNLVLNDYDARDGRIMESAAMSLKEELRRNKRNTRHFPLDVNSFTGPHGESLYSVQ